MKKLTVVLFLIALTGSSSMAQSKWFFLVSGGVTVGGPGGSLKNKMEADGFNSGEGNPVFITGFSGSFPHVFHQLPFFFTIGKSISTRGSILLMAGRSDGGEA